MDYDSEYEILSEAPSFPADRGEIFGATLCRRPTPEERDSSSSSSEKDLMFTNTHFGDDESDMAPDINNNHLDTLSDNGSEGIEIRKIHESVLITSNLLEAVSEDSDEEGGV